MIDPNVNWNEVPEDQGEYKRLEPGGYVAKLLRVNDVDEGEKGAYLSVEFDIAEGPFEGYYRQLYQRFQNNWNGKFRLYYRSKEGSVSYGRIKAFKTALEESNPGLNVAQFTQDFLRWLSDPSKHAPILFGVLMGYDKREHRYLNVYQTRSANVIRNGEFEIPAEWKIHVDSTSTSASYGGYGGGNSSAPVDDEYGPNLPF